MGLSAVLADCSLLHKWAGIALEEDWVGSWREGAIFPREMAWFMANLEDSGAELVIESGRQDGYSTWILGHHIDVVSIDLEEQRFRSWWTKRRLKNLPIQFVKGDGRILIPKIAEDYLPAAVAILCDGPKGQDAVIAMNRAADIGRVRLMGLHNVKNAPGTQFSFYEDTVLLSDGYWETLAFLEMRRLKGCKRSLTQSTLGIRRCEPV